MPRKGREFEKLISYLEESLCPFGVKVLSPEYIKGKLSRRSREVDITLRASVGSTDILIMVECRDRKDVEELNWLEQISGKKKDIEANKAIAVSTSGFSASAIEYAKNTGIELRTYGAVNPNEIVLWFGFNTLTTTHHMVDFVHTQIIPFDKDVEIAPDIKSIIEHTFTEKTKIFDFGNGKEEVSVWDLCCQTFNDNAKEMYEDIKPDTPPVQKSIALELKGKPIRIKSNKGYVEVKELRIVAKLSIIINEHPLTRIAEYKDGEKVIAKTAEFEFKVEDNIMSLDLHKFEPSGEQRIALRFKGNVSKE